MYDSALQVSYALACDAYSQKHLTPELLTFFDGVAAVETLRSAGQRPADENTNPALLNDETSEKVAIITEHLVATGTTDDNIPAIVNLLLFRPPSQPPSLFARMPSATLRTYLDKNRLSGVIPMPHSSMYDDVPERDSIRTVVPPAKHWPLNLVAGAAYTSRGPYLDPNPPHPGGPDPIPYDMLPHADSTRAALAADFARAPVRSAPLAKVTTGWLGCAVSPIVGQVIQAAQKDIA